MFNYPLSLSFKILALNPQVSVTDASGNLVLYIKQRAFALKEDVKIFADQAQTRQLYQLRADRIIDWSATYNISTADGQPLGKVRRKGARSIFKATYNIVDAAGSEVGVIREESFLIRLADSLVGGLLGGYLFHPAYLVELRGRPVLYLKKQPAFFEGRFKLEKRGEFSEDEEGLLLTSVVMTLMLERLRG